MNVNECLDEAFKAVAVARDNADTARIAIKQRDFLLEAMKEISLIDYNSLSVTDWECLRDAIVIANVALARVKSVR